MKIYGMSMSRSFRALWAAEEVGIDYDYVEMAFGSTEENGTQSAQYLSINPQGKVPTLTDGFVTITESAAIVNYLAAKKPALKLIPADGTAERALYDQMCFFILAELEQPLWNNGKHRFALPEEYRVAELLDKTTSFEFAKAQAALLILKGDNEYAAGDHFTMADILLTQTISWAEKFEFELAPTLLTYRDAMIQRPAFAAAKARLKP